MEKQYKPFNILNANRIPAQLKDPPNWVVWRLEEKNGELTKVPYQAKHPSVKANSTDPGTWAGFTEAIKAFKECENDGIMGIGFVFTNSPFSGIDLDQCIDPETKAVEPWALEIISKLSSYTEYSPSGTGVKLFVNGKLPLDLPGRRNGKIEIYSEGRYFTVTGNLFEKRFLDVKQREDELRELHTKYIKKDRPPKTGTPVTVAKSSPPMTDEEVISRVTSSKNGEKFVALYEGNWEGKYLSQSEAEFAFVGILQFWTQDGEQIKRIVNGSGLHREKTERNDYMDRTIKNATPSETYLGLSQGPKPLETSGPGEVEKPIRRESRSIAESVREFMESTSDGNFTTHDICFEMGIPDEARHSVTLELRRLVTKGILKDVGTKRGTYRKVQDELIRINYQEEMENGKPLPIRWPFEIEKLVNTYRKNVVVIAGTQNAGKTAFLLNLAELNMKDFQVRYLTSEMGGEELHIRVKEFGEERKKAIWNGVEFFERCGNFSDVILPDGLNIIDYLDLTDEFYRVKEKINEIWQELRSGTAFIGLQKDPGKTYGRGSTFGLELPRTYLTIDPGVVKMAKGKLWHQKGVNPNGLVIDFTLSDGCMFAPIGGWYHENSIYKPKTK